MKSSVRVCEQRKSSEWKECSGSRKPNVVVYSRWKLELIKINTFTAMKDSKPALQTA